jgi:hypothetical protein
LTIVMHGEHDVLARVLGRRRVHRYVRSGLKHNFRSPRTRGKSLSRGRRTRGRRPRPEGAEGAEGATDPPQPEPATRALKFP